MTTEYEETKAVCEGYWYLALPYVEGRPSPWHPTEAEGPFSTLTSGCFLTYVEAEQWAAARLNGGPYSIRFSAGCGYIQAAVEIQWETPNGPAVIYDRMISAENVAVCVPDRWNVAPVETHRRLPDGRWLAALTEVVAVQS